MRGEEAAARVAGVLFGMCFVFVVPLVIFFFFLLTLEKALKRVSPGNRLMQPGLVWLTLIPLFNSVWIFFVATRVPDSLRKEFSMRRQGDGSDYGKGIGLAYAIIMAAFLPLIIAANLNLRTATVLGLITLAASLAGLVCFIIFWVRIAAYSRQLGDRRYIPHEDEYDRGAYPEDFDDRPPPRGPESPPDAIRPDDRDRFRQ